MNVRYEMFYRPLPRFSRFFKTTPLIACEDRVSWIL